MNITKKMGEMFVRHRAPALIFILSLAVKLVASLILTAVNGPALLAEGDASGYLGIAESLATGNGFLMDGVVSALRTPLYPLFLSLFYLTDTLSLIPLAQILLLSFTSVLVYKTGTLIFSSRAGIIAGVLFAIEPLMTVYAHLALSESLFVFLLTASIYTLLRYSEHPEERTLLALAGILAGATALTRPLGLYLPILAILFMAVKILREKNLASALKLSAFYLLFFLFTIFPWSLRNHLIFGSWNITNQGANEIFIERVPVVIAAEEGVDYNTAFKLNQERLARAIPNFDKNKLAHTFEYNDYLAEEATRILKTDIPALLRFHLVAALSYFHTTGYDYVLHYLGVENDTARTNFTHLILLRDWRGLAHAILGGDFYNTVRIAGYALWFILNLAIAASILVSLTRSRRHAFALAFLVGLVLYFAALSIGPHTQARYRIPTYPFLFILVGFATITLYDTLKKSGVRSHS